MARLLLPEEIGIFSVAISFITLGHMLRDFGIGEYLIQEAELTSEKIRSGFTMSVMLAWVLAIIIYAISAPLAAFYEQEGIGKVLPVIAFNFLLIPFGSITIALLRRNLRLDLMLRINLSSALANALVSIVLAMNGFSYMSLAWGAVAGTLTSVIVSQFFRPTEFSFIPTLSGARAIVAYGGYNTLTNFSSNISTSAPDLILGKMLGMHTVGIFNRGKSLLNMISGLIIGGTRPVLLPFFSAKSRSNRQELALSYLQMTDILLAVLWPVLAFVILYASEVILFLFGENWAEAGPVVQILGVGSMVWLAVSFASDLFKATGNIRLLARITLTMSVVRVGAILLGGYFSFQMVVILFSFTSLLHCLLVMQKLRQYVGISIRKTLKIMGKNAVVTVAVVAPTLLVRLTSYDSTFITLLISGSIFAVAWAACMYVIHKPLFEKLILRKDGEAEADEQ